MSRFIRPICFGLLVATLAQPVWAQIGGGGGRRVQGQGISYAPEPQVFAVLSVDAQDRTIELRAADGRTGLVLVGASVYDLLQAQGRRQDPGRLRPARRQDPAAARRLDLAGPVMLSAPCLP